MLSNGREYADYRARWHFEIAVGRDFIEKVRPVDKEKYIHRAQYMNDTPQPKAAGDATASRKRS